MKIAMIGTGYVGLVAGACFAEFGHDVICVDRRAQTVDLLNRGEVPIYEPGLDRLIERGVVAGRLRFTLDTAHAVAGADAAFIAVGTPPRDRDGEPDLSLVYTAAKDIAAAMTDDLVVVTKSTVPVGTGDVIERIMRRSRPDLSVWVASCPEFLREGTAVGDFLHPDRVVLGVEDGRAMEVLEQVFASLRQAGVPICVTRRRTAELIKYTSNAFLATKISFINEIADLCECVGVDVTELATGVGLDHRIGREFLKVGPGYGGSCFPKDTLALLHSAQDYGVSLRIVEGTVSVNNTRRHRMALKVVEAAGGSVRGRKVAVLGLTFKPDTDDMREAPSIYLIRNLQRSGARIAAFDPQGMERAREILDDISFHSDPYLCATDADVVVLMTEWEAIKSLDLDRLREAMRVPAVVDLRNIRSPDEWHRHGFHSIGIGRPNEVETTAYLDIPDEVPDAEGGSRVRQVDAREEMAK